MSCPSIFRKIILVTNNTLSSVSFPLFSLFPPTNLYIGLYLSNSFLHKYTHTRTHALHIKAACCRTRNIHMRTHDTQSRSEYKSHLLIAFCTYYRVNIILKWILHCIQMEWSNIANEIEYTEERCRSIFFMHFVFVCCCVYLFFYIYIYIYYSIQYFAILYPRWKLNCAALANAQIKIRSDTSESKCFWSSRAFLHRFLFQAALYVDFFLENYIIHKCVMDALDEPNIGIYSINFIKFEKKN